MKVALGAVLVAALSACHTGGTPAGSEARHAAARPALATPFELPSFLPPYYAPAFDVGVSPLELVHQENEAGGEQYGYQTKDGALAITVENIPCEPSRCREVFRVVLTYWNGILSRNGGSFLEVEATEAHARATEGGVTRRMFAFALPSSVQIWTYNALGGASDPRMGRYDAVRRFVDEQRYHDALAQGNVSMGNWRERIAEHANDLIDRGAEEEALGVLENLLATSPYDHEAHMAYVEHASDPSRARSSARIVLDDAERRSLIESAARALDREIPALEDVSQLDPSEGGLRVVLVPLAPCNPWILDEAARIFERITEIPVSVRRLPEAWAWDPPERVSNQRAVQKAIVALKEEDVDFSGWTTERYVRVLREEAGDSDPLTRYHVNAFAERILAEPGQYLADTYLERFSNALDGHRADDPRTMYVAITEHDIYAGDNNFVFSIGRAGPRRGSLLSYHRMLGETLNAEFDSRPRLVERIAKEMVPASLKQLGIPRSTDPTCPYSYSSGVARLDQKTLTLSDPVRAAIERLR